MGHTILSLSSKELPLRLPGHQGTLVEREGGKERERSRGGEGGREWRQRKGGRERGERIWMNTFFSRMTRAWHWEWDHPLGESQPHSCRPQHDTYISIWPDNTHCCARNKHTWCWGEGVISAQSTAYAFIVCVIMLAIGRQAQEKLSCWARPWGPPDWEPFSLTKVPWLLNVSVVHGHLGHLYFSKTLSVMAPWNICYCYL